MFAIAEMSSEVLVSIHPEITLLRAVAVAVVAIFDQQWLDILFKCLIGHGRGAKEEQWEKTMENHDLVIRLEQVRAFQLICKLGDWVKGFSKTESFF